MRLWSIHPRYLDRQGLTACWREALLAQAVLAGRTAGYRAHPQLVRFRAQPSPGASIGAYLQAVAEEASERGYRFDRTRIDAGAESRQGVPKIPVTTGQIDLEWSHLLAKLARRSPARWEESNVLSRPEVHPLFALTNGDVEAWERATR